MSKIKHTLVLALLLPSLITSEVLEEARLSESIRPSKYDVELSLDPSQGTFSGTAKITLSAVRANIRSITLNIADLAVGSEWRLERPDVPGLTIPKGVSSENKELQTVSFAFSITLALDTPYLLIVPFSGKFQKDRGIFEGESGGQKFIATNFAPNFARYVIPSFDEPLFKAEFQLHLRGVAGFRTVLANGLEVDERSGNEIKFRSSKNVAPPHSFGFTLLNFYELSNTRTISVWSRSEGADDKNFAMTTAEKIVRFINDFTGYSLQPLTDKIELVGLPDLPYCGVELLGSAYLREEFVVASEQKSGCLDRQRMVQELSNKIARQWFGILVTPEYWSHVWVSHGLSKYFETLAFSEAFELKEQFNCDLQEALLSESCGSSHALENLDLGTVEKESHVFQDDLYSVKGAAVLRWIEAIQGSDNFRVYLRRFVKENEFKTVTTETLRKALDEDFLETNVYSIFKEWIELPGYPLISVSRDGRNLTLQQSRFSLHQQEGSTDSTLWHIPISLAVNRQDFDKIAPSHLFPKQADWELQLESDSAPFYVLNTQQIGYYRVNYDRPNWNALKEVLKREAHEIHVLNRAQIVDDLFALAEAEHLDYDFAFDILEYLHHETDLQPWKSALRGFHRLALRQPSQPLADYDGLFKSYMRWFAKPIFSELGFSDKDEETSHLQKLLRSEVLYFACRFGLEECTVEASKIFREFRSSGQMLAPDQQFPVFCSAIRGGGRDDFNFLWQAYLNEDFEAQKQRILRGLTCTKDQELVKSLLEKLLTPEIRNHNKFSTFEHLINENLENTDTVLAHLEINWREWNEQLCIVSTLKSVSNTITKDSQVDKLLGILRTLKSEGTLTGEQEKEIEEAAAHAKYLVEWANRRLPELHRRMQKLDFGKNSGFRSFQSVLALVLGLAICVLIRQV